MNIVKKLLLIVKVNSLSKNKSVNNNALTHAAQSTLDSLSKSDYLLANHWEVEDNNGIYLGIHEHQPDYVIIDGLWVVPEKFKELGNLYPKIKWIIRIHSEIPFVAQEGIFSDWLYKYLNIENVYIAFNSKNIYKAAISSIDQYKKSMIYLPNLYVLNDPNVVESIKMRHKEKIKIGIFGAARILKNQYAQAFAALDFAETLDKPLELFININTRDPNGLPIYLNIINLIKNHPSKRHTIKMVEWTTRENFLNMLSEIDISMQVSLTETFNLVSCDSLLMNTPVIGSGEIPWLSKLSSCRPTHHKSIVNALYRAYFFPEVNVYLNKRNLIKYVNRSLKEWELLLVRKLP